MAKKGKKRSVSGAVAAGLAGATPEGSGTGPSVPVDPDVAADATTKASAKAEARDQAESGGTRKAKKGKGNKAKDKKAKNRKAKDKKAEDKKAKHKTAKDAKRAKKERARIGDDAVRALSDLAGAARKRLTKLAKKLGPVNVKRKALLVELASLQQGIAGALRRFGQEESGPKARRAPAKK